ncbi:MAG: hypothetical protein E7Y34_01005 [Mycoplasma sp.]|nr:hypothetical protein [Mycoplasma sp.]
MNSENKKKPIYGELPLSRIKYVSDGDVKAFVIFELKDGETIGVSKKCIFKTMHQTFKFLLNPDWEYGIFNNNREKIKTLVGTQIFDEYIKNKCEVKKVFPYEKL